MTPQSDAEREAVRRYLEQLRRKTEAPATENTTSTPAARDFAIVDVRMPAGAKLFIDSTPFPINSTENRTFRTPSLQEGQQYFYILRAEMERDGQTVVQNQRVQLTAGQRLNVQFNMDSLQTVQR